MEKLSDDLFERIQLLADEIGTAFAVGHEYFNGHSDEWKNSKAGDLYLAWVDTLEEAASQLRDLTQTLGE